MADGKKTFIFYSDWINMIREMPNSDAGALLKHVLSYVNDENPNTDNLLVKMAFGHMKPMLKKDLDKWEVIREKRKEAGSKGGKANAKQNEANAKQVEAVNDNVNVNDNKNVSKDINTRKQEFYNSLIPFLEIYDKQLLKEFFDYWSEHGEKDKKFRKEKQTSFDVSLRLKTWLKKSKEFKSKPAAENNKNVSAAEIIQKRLGIYHE